MEVFNVIRVEDSRCYEVPASSFDIKKHTERYNMEVDCISKKRRLFVIHGDSWYNDDPASDYLYVVKLKSSKLTDFQSAEIENVTEDDKSFVNSYRGEIYGVYSYWGKLAIIYLAKKKAKYKSPHENKELDEIESGYTKLRKRYENLYKQATE